MVTKDRPSLELNVQSSANKALEADSADKRTLSSNKGPDGQSGERIRGLDKQQQQQRAHRNTIAGKRYVVTSDCYQAPSSTEGDSNTGSKQVIGTDSSEEKENAPQTSTKNEQQQSDSTSLSADSTCESSDSAISSLTSSARSSTTSPSSLPSSSASSSSSRDDEPLAHSAPSSISGEEPLLTDESERNHHEAEQAMEKSMAERDDVIKVTIVEKLAVEIKTDTGEQFCSTESMVKDEANGDQIESINRHKSDQNTGNISNQQPTVSWLSDGNSSYRLYPTIATLNSSQPLPPPSIVHPYHHLPPPTHQASPYDQQHYIVSPAALYQQLQQQQSQPQPAIYTAPPANNNHLNYYQHQSHHQNHQFFHSQQQRSRSDVVQHPSIASFNQQPQHFYGNSAPIPLQYIRPFYQTTPTIYYCPQQPLGPQAYPIHYAAPTHHHYRYQQAQNSFQYHDDSGQSSSSRSDTSNLSDGDYEENETPVSEDSGGAECANDEESDGSECSKLSICKQENVELDSKCSKCTNKTPEVRKTKVNDSVYSAQALELANSNSGSVLNERQQTNTATIKKKDVSSDLVLKNGCNPEDNCNCEPDIKISSKRNNSQQKEEQSDKVARSQCLLSHDEDFKQKTKSALKSRPNNHNQHQNASSGALEGSHYFNGLAPNDHKELHSREQLPSYHGQHYLPHTHGFSGLATSRNNSSQLEQSTQSRDYTAHMVPPPPFQYYSHLVHYGINHQPQMSHHLHHHHVQQQQQQQSQPQNHIMTTYLYQPASQPTPTAIAPTVAPDKSHQQGISCTQHHQTIPFLPHHYTNNILSPPTAMTITPFEQLSPFAAPWFPMSSHQQHPDLFSRTKFHQPYPIDLPNALAYPINPSVFNNDSMMFNQLDGCQQQPYYQKQQFKLATDLVSLLPIDAEPTKTRQAYGMDKVWQDEFEQLFSQFVSDIGWTLFEVETNPNIRDVGDIIGYKGRYIIRVPTNKLDSCSTPSNYKSPSPSSQTSPSPSSYESSDPEIVGNNQTNGVKDTTDLIRSNESQKDLKFNEVKSSSSINEIESDCDSGTNVNSISVASIEDSCNRSLKETDECPVGEELNDSRLQSLISSGDSIESTNDIKDQQISETQADGDPRQATTKDLVNDRRFPIKFKMFIDSAKVRFCCDHCGHGWTSMKGRVVFWYELFELIDYNDGRDSSGVSGGTLVGYCAFKLFGQQCDVCKIENRFERPMWYPEEVTKVLNNLYNKIGQVYFGFRMPAIDKQRRAGKPKTSHNSSLCQACHDGVCTDRK